MLFVEIDILGMVNGVMDAYKITVDSLSLFNFTSFLFLQNLREITWVVMCSSFRWNSIRVGKKNQFVLKSYQIFKKKKWSLFPSTDSFHMQIEIEFYAVQRDVNKNEFALNSDPETYPHKTELTLAFNQTIIQESALNDIEFPELSFQGNHLSGKCGLILSDSFLPLLINSKTLCRL